MLCIKLSPCLRTRVLFPTLVASHCLGATLPQELVPPAARLEPAVVMALGSALAAGSDPFADLAAAADPAKDPFADIGRIGDTFAARVA